MDKYRSWPMKDWPSDIYPNDKRKAARLIRQHRTELMQAGAVSRIGKELCVFGEPWLRWLYSHRADATKESFHKSRAGEASAVGMQRAKAVAE